MISSTSLATTLRSSTKSLQVLRPAWVPQDNGGSLLRTPLGLPGQPKSLQPHHVDHSHSNHQIRSPLDGGASSSPYPLLLTQPLSPRDILPSYFPIFTPSNTAFVSASCPNSPRFRICPIFGTFSLGCAASALRYACCTMRVRNSYECVGALAERVGGGAKHTHLFPMMQALLVILELRETLFCAGDVLGGRVDDVAGQHLLPEGEAAGLAYARALVWLVWLIVACF